MSELSTHILGAQNPTGVVICFHGLGANSRNLANTIDPLIKNSELRFIFPDAPQRPISINHGQIMPAWYDIHGLGFGSAEDDVGIRSACKVVTQLIETQIIEGIAAERVVLAGFSQGAALALYCGLSFKQRLGGIIALSGYLPLSHTIDRWSANQDIPIFMAHGTQDEIVTIELAQYSYQCLTNRYRDVEFVTYPMGHEICFQELNDISKWLTKILPLIATHE
jgi:phospholipase/carboxylesterase